MELNFEFGKRLQVNGSPEELLLLCGQVNQLQALSQSERSSHNADYLKQLVMAAALAQQSGHTAWAQQLLMQAQQHMLPADGTPTNPPNYVQELPLPTPTPPLPNPVYETPYANSGFGNASNHQSLPPASVGDDYADPYYNYRQTNTLPPSVPTPSFNNPGGLAPTELSVPQPPMIYQPKNSPTRLLGNLVTKLDWMLFQYPQSFWYWFVGLIVFLSVGTLTSPLGMTFLNSIVNKPAITTPAPKTESTQAKPSPVAPTPAPAPAAPAKPNTGTGTPPVEPPSL